MTTLIRSITNYMYCRHLDDTESFFADISLVPEEKKKNIKYAIFTAIYFRLR